MNWQPTLESERVIIRPLKEGDMESLYDAAKDPAIWDQHWCKRYLRPEFENYFHESIESGGAMAILDKKTQKIIGSSRFQVLEGFPNAIEIGWTFIRREYWGGTFNAEIKDKMVNHAFRQVDTVFLFIDKNNFRSQKAAEKIGAVESSKLPKEELPATRSTNYIYILEKSQWK